jgi:hypothetical protein
MNEKFENPEQIAFETKWLNKIVKLRETSDYELPRTPYTVTSALYKWDDNGSSIFAILSDEYERPDKPWWYTMRFDDISLIDDHFEVVGEHHNADVLKATFAKVLVSEDK